MQYDFDIGVVGAGPSGARLAWRLAREGVRVAVFDASHPREKPCGGGVTGRALGRVAEMLDPATLDAVIVERADFDAGPAVRASVPLESWGFTPRSSMVVVARNTFDAALASAAEQAGATWIRERVTDVVVGPAAVDLATRARRVRVGRVVGADGPTSLVRRRAAVPFARHLLSTARGVFAYGASSRAIAIGFVAAPPGYAWSFPRHDHLSIGICAQAHEASPAALDAQLQAWLSHTGLAAGCPTARYGWPIPSLDVETLRRDHPAGDRWMLVGDAAGLVDPITREGITFALESADLAAESLAGPAAASAYVTALRHQIVPELTRAARLKRGFFRGRFTGLLVRGLQVSAPVRTIMADLVAGRQPYATLRRRLLTTFEVGLAWQLFWLEVGGRRRRDAS